MIARMCIALDPPAPIRYRGLAVMPTGIPDMLVEAMLTGHNLQALSEIIASQLMTFWVEMQAKARRAVAARPAIRAHEEYDRKDHARQRRRARRVRAQRRLAMPIPDAEIPVCNDAQSLLPALERVAAQPGRPASPWTATSPRFWWRATGAVNCCLKR